MRDGKDEMGLVRRLRRWIATALLAAFSPLVFSCYGQFPLTRAVYKINGAVPTGILEQVVFWVFALGGVYGVTMVADAVALNLLEFWFGLELDLVEAYDARGNHVVLEPGEDENVAVLTVESREGEVSRLRFIRVSPDLTEVRDGRGQLVGMVERDGADTIELQDARGRVMRRVDGSQLPAATDREPGAGDRAGHWRAGQGG
jgi:hypothetical protein